MEQIIGLHLLSDAEVCPLDEKKEVKQFHALVRLLQ